MGTVQVGKKKKNNITITIYNAAPQPSSLASLLHFCQQFIASNMQNNKFGHVYYGIYMTTWIN